MLAVILVRAHRYSSHNPYTPKTDPSLARSLTGRKTDRGTRVFTEKQHPAFGGYWRERTILK